MKNIAAIVFAAFSLASPSVFAQAPATVQEAPALNPPTKEAVRALLEAMKVRQMVKQSFDQMLKNMPPAIMNSTLASINGNATLSAEQKKTAQAEASKKVPVMITQIESLLSDPALIEELLNETVPLYARHFSSAEIEQLTAFYKGPLGSKMLAVSPQIMGESMQISQRIVAPRIQKIMEQAAKSK